MKEGLIKNTYELIIKEIQTIITVLYLLMIGIGMLFKYHLYLNFGINIFEYADIFDFLIAPFQDSFIMGLAFLATVIPIITYNLDVWWLKKYPESYTKSNFGWNKKPWFNTYRYIAFGLLWFSAILNFALIYADSVKHDIKSQESITILYENGESTTGKMIGKTKEMLFLLEEEKVKIIPITSMVKEIEYPPIKFKD